MTDSTGRKTTRGKFDRILNSSEAKAAASDELDAGDITKRLDDLEVKLEQIGLAEKYLGSFNDYCSALKRDQEALTAIRWAAVIFAFALILVLIGGLAYVLLWRGVTFWLISDVSKAAIIVAVVGGAIGVLLALLKGSFRTISERNNDDVLPEHLKALLDAAKSVMGKGS